MAEDATKDTRKVEDLSFKEASVELEQIVRSLEAGDLELEESLERYSRGVELLKSLRERLANAEQKVRVLLDATDEDAPVTDTPRRPPRPTWTTSSTAGLSCPAMESHCRATGSHCRGGKSRTHGTR